MMQRPFHERWKMLEKEVIEPRNQERHGIYQSRNSYYRYDLEPFRVRLIIHGYLNVNFPFVFIEFLANFVERKCL